MDVVAFVLGVVLLAVAFWDVFETIVVPRPTPGWFRIGRYLVRGAWRIVRGVAQARTSRTGMSPTADRLLGLFAPATAIALLAVWLVSVIFGYGLILYAVRDQLRPVPNLGTSIYFAAESVLTLGYGDIVAHGPLARIVVAASAVTGLGMVALVITFLFSLFGSYQRREVAVVILQARAGVPPSAVVLLKSMKRLDLLDRLPDYFAGWSTWAAEVLDSHVAYPLLGFFRSSHDNLSWISALGTMLDAASLVTSTIRGIPRGDAALLREVGAHLVEDITNLGFREGTHDGLGRDDFDEVYRRLEHAGFDLEPADVAWPAFAAARATYAERLEAMAQYWAVRSMSWFGEKEELRSPTHAPTAPIDRPESAERAARSGRGGR